MELRRRDDKIEAAHGAIASLPRDFFGYFGWPTVARMDDGSLVAAASGLRNAHVCPFADRQRRARSAPGSLMEGLVDALAETGYR